MSVGCSRPEPARPPAVAVRPLGPDDLGVVHELEDELFGASAWSRSLLAAELQAPGRFYVAAVDLRDERDARGTLIGYAGLWFDGDDAQVMTIAVAPDRQGRGTGRLLLDALVAEARMLGARSVLLEVRVDNDAALRLYEAAGFVRLGLRKRYYQPEDVDAWTMRLALVPEVD